MIKLPNLPAVSNEMAASLERFQKEEVARFEFESDVRMAERVQEHLFPRQAPIVSGAAVAGRTLPARTVGGDLRAPANRFELAANSCLRFRIRRFWFAGSTL